MKALVVYDSVWGNTEKIAQAIGGSLGAAGDVETVRAGDATQSQLTGAELLVVGSPTQKFTMLGSLAKLLKRIPDGGLTGINVAAFDTRFSIDEPGPRILKFLVRIFGYAAEPIADRLVKKGGQLVVPPAGFIMKGTRGPLKDEELERAADWAKEIIAAT